MHMYQESGNIVSKHLARLSIEKLVGRLQTYCSIHPIGLS